MQRETRIWEFFFPSPASTLVPHWDRNSTVLDQHRKNISQQAFLSSGVSGRRASCHSEVAPGGRVALGPPRSVIRRFHSRPLSRIPGASRVLRRPPVAGRAQRRRELRAPRGSLPSEPNPHLRTQNPHKRHTLIFPLEISALKFLFLL